MSGFLKLLSQKCLCACPYTPGHFANGAFTDNIVAVWLAEQLSILVPYVYDNSKHIEPLVMMGMALRMKCMCIRRLS